MKHYVEGLPTKYWANMRQHNTLAAAMDEAIQIEVDLATPERTIVKYGENREWEGHSDSSNKKKRFFGMKG